MTVKTLRATSGGKDRIIGMWRLPEDGVFSELYSIASEARNHVTGLQIAYQNIHGDIRRSEVAKREDGQKSAKERLYFLGQLQRKLDGARAAIQERASLMSAVQPYRDGDFTTVQIDLALASQLREMPPERRTSILFLGTDKRYVDAALRLPRELTGVSAEWYAKVQREAMVRANPREAQEIEELLLAAEDAQDTVRTAFSIIAGDGGIPLDDRVDAAGDSAKDLVTGVRESTIDRIQDRLADDADGEDEEIAQKIEVA
ncbi:hypothetical protein FEA48_11055 [Pseudomonas nitroreducens]|uniref:Uncharacterized protein n=1 Tax=Pseudomonas nitroreducens TaxID=46680 RepID=A0A5R9A9N5_PSENT|nr:hypothetical protein [Pseudomonas nitroreducens]TLP74745.1 hypothetical protein FEA48_11055 [Pseudomonas nitroreducens]